MKDWSASWRFIVPVLCICVTVSGTLGVLVALLLNGHVNGYEDIIPWPRWEWPVFAATDLQPQPESQTAVILARDPKYLIDDYDLFGLSDEAEPAVVSIAKTYLGIPYEYAGNSNPIDCSGLTVAVFRQFGITLPRTTYGQVELGTEIHAIEEMLPGDLIFFENTSNGFQIGVTHVGIYIGNHQMIHASLSIGYVAITSINDPFYVEHWHSVRRILEPR